MERKTIVCCFQCQQPIISGEDFVRFKVPGKETYEFFHRRFRVGDCWEGHLKQSKENFASCRAFKTFALRIADKTTSLQVKGDLNAGTEYPLEF